MSASAARECRRWLWERCNVAAGHRRPVPDVVESLWDGDSVRAARSLRTLLTSLVEQDICTAEDALAWSLSAALDGRRTSRAATAAARKLSLRGLEGRLLRVETMISRASVQDLVGVQTPRFEPIGPILLALIDGTSKRLKGDHDAADGAYAAAARLADLDLSPVGRPVGRDRSRRSRARARVLAEVELVEAPEQARRARALTAESLTITSSKISCDPHDALNELENAWRRGERGVLPLLLSHAYDLIPDAHAAGLGSRIRLLEIGSNLFRDAESIAGIGWASAWIVDARLDQQVDVRAIVNGLKTRAHILQLHGFHAKALEDLKKAKHFFSKMSDMYDDRTLIGVDIGIRAVAVNLLSGNLVEARSQLETLSDEAPTERMKISTARHQLHLESMNAAESIERRVFRGKYARTYEKARDVLMEFSRIGPHSAFPAVADTIIASAARVGDVSTIRQIAEEIPYRMTRGPLAANTLARLEGRVRRASNLPELKALRDLPFDIPEDLFRVEALIPHHLSNLL